MQRLKTVSYAFPALASMVNNTLTNLTQITVYLPETGTKTFRKATLNVSCDDIITATGGSLTTKTVNLRLAAVAYTSVANGNTLTNSGENLSFHISQDFTSHFTTNWTGTSMTCDVQLQFNQSTGTTLNMVNVCATLDITYEYDDTSATQVKTVMIPLNAPVGAMGTAKPAAVDTIPVLDTYLPERGKTIRDYFITIQGNEHRNGATTDHTMSMEIDALGVTTTGNYEGSLASDRWIRYVWRMTAPATNATHSFYVWASVARVNHAQIWLTVTYEFTDGGPVTTAWAATTAKSLNDKVYGTNASGKDIAFICTTAGTTGSTEPTWNVDRGDTTTDGTVTWTVLSAKQSVLLPQELASPMGGTASTDATLGQRDMWIQEPGPVEDSTEAFFIFWSNTTALTGLNMRLGTGSYVAYTDTASNFSGSNGAMIRNDAAHTLARGRNSIGMNVYNTGSTVLGYMLSGFWMISWTSAQHRLGQGAHQKTVLWPLQVTGTGASASGVTVTAEAIQIPETDYYITGIGVEFTSMQSGTTAPNGVALRVERLSAEGGPEWMEVVTDIESTDPEAGLRRSYSQCRDVFKRRPNDVGAGRVDIETARRWRCSTGTGTFWFKITPWMTYHSITYAIAGNVTNSSGGTVTIRAHRDSDGERLATTSRTGNGAYSITWYDNTESVYTEARESGTLLGRSDAGVAE